MNIYKIQIQGETDCVYSNFLYEAKTFYCNLTDIFPHEFNESCAIEIIPPDEWGKWIVIDIDIHNEDGSHPILYTFEEYLKTAVETEIIYTTTYN